MVIRALGKEFEVIHMREMWQGYEVLECRPRGEQQEYVILHFVKESFVKELLPIFYPMQENKDYEDYIGCFTRSEDLYVVFYKRKGIPLRKLLMEHTYSLQKRMLIGKQVLEKLLLWNPLELAACQMLNVDNILIRDDQVFFSYEWDLPYELPGDMNAVNQKMADLLKNLFEDEIAKAMSPVLMELLEALEQNRPSDYFAVYEAYNRLYEILPQEAETYVSGLQRVRNRMVRIGKTLLGIGKLALFLAAYIAVIYLFVLEMRMQEEEKLAEQGVIFEKIGTLTIR